MAIAKNVAIFDTLVTGVLTTEPVMTLNFEQLQVSARTIIVERVKAEAENIDQHVKANSNSLIQLDEKERLLNPSTQSKTHYEVDIDKHCQVAIEAFNQNRFLLIVDEQQIESLDEKVHLNDHSQVAFYRLLPLVGG